MQPRLITVRQPRRPRGAVLVLHGGGSRPGSPMVSPAQLSVLRMRPIAARIARRSRDLAVYRLLNSHRGWDPTTTPVDDVRWALRRLGEQHEADLPTVLVGHSLGGRAALLAGDAAQVRGVVALNPWVLPSDHVDLRGRRVLVVHGTADRIASIERSRALADRIGRTADVRFEEVEGGKHAMLRSHGAFERPAAEFAASVLGST